jgi:hypothetical protein
VVDAPLDDHPLEHGVDLLIGPPWASGGAYPGRAAGGKYVGDGRRAAAGCAPNAAGAWIG